MNILHLVPHPGPSRLQREWSLLLESNSQTTVRVCALTGAGGLANESLAWTRTLDPRPLWRLGRLLREFRPDVVQAWGLAALSALRLAAPTWRGLVMVTRPIPAHRPCNLLQRRWLRGVDRVLVRGAAEAQRCRQIGIPADRLHLLPPGVAVQPWTESQRPVLVCAGALQPHLGFWDAIWTLDILHFVCPDAELVIAGQGPERQRLQDFADNTGLRQRIHFMAEPADLPALLQSAAVVWVPSRADTGMSVALEAMAVGRPVLASRWPGLAEVVVEGETGWLVEPGDKMKLAQKTRQLLNDPLLRRRMGQAGRRRVADHYSVQHYVQNWWQHVLGTAAVLAG